MLKKVSIIFLVISALFIIFNFNTSNAVTSGDYNYEVKTDGNIDSTQNDVTSSIERYDRPDVTGSITGYGTAEQNPLAGFKGTVDIRQYKDGTHTLIIQAIHNETGEIIGEAEQKFTVQKYNTQLYIDYPIQNAQEKNG